MSTAKTTEVCIIKQSVKIRKKQISFWSDIGSGKDNGVLWGECHTLRVGEWEGEELRGDSGFKEDTGPLCKHAKKKGII